MPPFALVFGNQVTLTVESCTVYGNPTIAVLGDDNSIRWTTAIPWPQRLNPTSCTVFQAGSFNAPACGFGGGFGAMDQWGVVASFADVTLLTQGKVDATLNYFAFSGYTTSHVVGAYTSVAALIGSRPYWVIGVPPTFNAASYINPCINSLNAHLAMAFNSYYLAAPAMNENDYVGGEQFTNDGGALKIARIVRNLLVFGKDGPTS